MSVTGQFGALIAQVEAAGFEPARALESTEYAARHRQEDGVSAQCWIRRDGEEGVLILRAPAATVVAAVESIRPATRAPRVFGGRRRSRG